MENIPYSLFHGQEAIMPSKVEIIFIRIPLMGIISIEDMGHISLPPYKVRYSQNQRTSCILKVSHLNY